MEKRSFMAITSFSPFVDIETAEEADRAPGAAAVLASSSACPLWAGIDV
jgi:hypothetical protein